VRYVWLTELLKCITVRSETTTEPVTVYRNRVLPVNPFWGDPESKSLGSLGGAEMAESAVTFRTTLYVINSGVFMEIEWWREVVEPYADRIDVVYREFRRRLDQMSEEERLHLYRQSHHRGTPCT
jgi:hypothetical protein